MKLLTKELISRFAEIGDQSQKRAENTIVVAKFFNPVGAGTWYATEMCYNITNVNQNTQVPKLREPSIKENSDTVQDLLKQENIGNEKKESGVDRSREAKLQGNNNGQRICDDLQSEPSVSKKELCKESNLNNGEEVGKIFGKERSSASQELDKGGRQDRELGVDDKNSTQVISYEGNKQETLDINASELSKYPNAKINSISFFGYVSIFGDWNDELGYFMLDELEGLKLPYGMTIERVRGFSECKLSSIMTKL